MTGSLTPTEQLNRQRSDHLMLATLDASPAPVFVTGHRTAEDVRVNQNPVPVGNRTPPAHYRVVYDFDTLSGPGQRHRPTIVHIAPLASGNYPTTQPSAWVVSEVVPWTPHFAANVPICHGNHAWISNRTQLVDYVVHIGKLLNFDEPPPVQGYHGYNSQAVEHWRGAMGLQPLNPDLRLPTIRAEDVIRAPDRMRRVRDAAPAPSRFQRARLPGAQQPTAAAAQPRFARASPGTDEPQTILIRRRFAPAGGRR